MENLPKPPAKDIQYGILQPDCEKKYKDWIVALVNEAIKNPKKKVDIANEIYEEVLQLGYDYGRDSSDEDRSWEY